MSKLLFNAKLLPAFDYFEHYAQLLLDLNTQEWVE